MRIWELEGSHEQVLYVGTRASCGYEGFIKDFVEEEKISYGDKGKPLEVGM